MKYFRQVTGASTLRELDTPTLLKFDAWLKSQTQWADSYRLMFVSKIQAVISYGKKRGFDVEEIDKALSRLVVVERPKIRNKYESKPITVSDWKALFAATDGKKLERAMVLMGLNCALYCQDLSDLLWKYINLEAGTLVMDRGKTGFLRVSTLWPETIAALNAIKPAVISPELPVFCSRRGTAYKADSLRDLFIPIRPVGLEFNQLRDGAYTSSCGAGIAFQLCQIVAGHATGAGESDKYICRNPLMVKPACEAIYAMYMIG